MISIEPGRTETRAHRSTGSKDRSDSEVLGIAIGSRFNGGDCSKDLGKSTPPTSECKGFDTRRQSFLWSLLWGNDFKLSPVPCQVPGIARISYVSIDFSRATGIHPGLFDRSK